VVTNLDHDANFTPWVRAAEEAGAEVRIAEFDPASGLLEPEAVASLLDEKVRLVATCVASNAIGTVVDVGSVTRLAHEVGALVYLDAVHAGPHRLLDANALDADFLVASSYKFFGPHTGILFGRLDLLAELDVYKVRPAPSDPPDKLETGTQSFESVAGVAAAVDYLADLGEGETRRARLEAAYGRIGVHEQGLGSRFLEGLSELSRVSVQGVPTMRPNRVATFALSVKDMAAPEVAARLAAQGIYVWSGHYYALNAMERLGFLGSGGLVRIGFVHYNTVAEVDRALEALAAL
jgi:cysteine desulfurase family protein (TIGR01976 family)